MRLFLICFIIPRWVGSYPFAGASRIPVSGGGWFKKHTGQVLIAIVTEDQYQDDQAVGFGRIPFPKVIRLFFFDRHSARRHAVKVFHDVNSNGQLDFNPIRYSKEPLWFFQQCPRAGFTHLISKMLRSRFRKRYFADTHRFVKQVSLANPVAIFALLC